MITNVKLYGVFAPEEIMRQGLRLLIKQFDDMLAAEGCELTDYHVKNKLGSFHGRRYDVEFVWTGNSSAIKTDYEGWIHCKTTAQYVELG